MEDLEEAIAVHRRALDALPAGSPDRPARLKKLGEQLELLYERTEQIEVLMEANAVHREAAELQRALDAAADGRRGWMHLTEATCAQCGPVTTKTWLIVDLEGIEERPELADALRSGTLHHVACPQCEAALGAIDAPLLLRCPGPEPTLVFSPARGSTDAESRPWAASLVREWLALTGAPEDARPKLVLIPRHLVPVVLDQGLDSAWARFAEELDVSMREAAREAAQYEERFLGNGDVDALDTGVALVERVLAEPGADLAGALTKAELWNRAGFLFWRRYIARGEPSDLERAIAFDRRALAALPAGSPVRCPVLGSLGTSLHLRYERAASFEDLEEAIALWREAVAASASSPPELLEALGRLIRGLLARYVHTGRADDLEEAIAFARRAMDTSSCDPAAVSALGSALLIRYLRVGEPADLDECIAASRQARDPTSADQAACLDTLGAGLMLRYGQEGRVEDLEEAILVFRRDLESTPPGAAVRIARYTRLADALTHLYARTARMEHLQEAIALLRAAMEAPHAHLPALMGLSTALQRRYERTGRMEDLEECIALLRSAAGGSAPGSMVHPALLDDLGGVLANRYVHTRRTEDLQEAITLFRQAVEATPEGSPDRPGFLRNLGEGLAARHDRTESIDDLREAVAVHRRAVESVPVGDPQRPLSLGSLGGSLMRWYRHTKRTEDLAEAIAVHRQVVDALAPDSPWRPSALQEVAEALHERHRRTESMDDFQQAIALARQASELGRALHPDVAFRAAWARGRWWLGRSAWEEAVEAYGEAMSSLDTLYDVHVLRSDKLGSLRSAHHMYPGAAYSRARAGDLEGAVLAMEAGRARGVTEMLDRSRADLEAVEERAPEVVHRYRQAIEQLGQIERMAAKGGMSRTARGPEHGRRLPEQIREARAHLHAAVEAIRATPGGESFLPRPSAPALAAALEPGVPVIYLAATPVGGFALIVSRTADGLDVAPLWLGSLNEEAVIQLLQGDMDRYTPESWIGAYSVWQRSPGDREARARWHERITQTTRVLWDMAMGPIVAFLRERLPGIERAVLIPDGYLALVPWHAAWTQEAGGQPRYALDEVAFSYAPSARALGHAREIAARCGQSRLLLVDEPKPTSASPLPNSHHEVETAAAQFARDAVTRLAGQQCRRDDVLAAVAGADICHFACHGRSHFGEPLQSGLLMANDEILTVENLLAMPGRQSRMAILSACETGIVGTAVPNEVVALPSAFLQAGFAGVVASLWSVYDISASLLMARFYELWRTERLCPALALRRAQTWLRDLTHRDLVAHLEQLVPELVPRMSLETAEVLHFRALLQDPEARPFAAPVHWAAFCLTGV